MESELEKTERYIREIGQIKKQLEDIRNRLDKLEKQHIKTKAIEGQDDEK